jgi:hypothetical protein
MEHTFGIFSNPDLIENEIMYKNEILFDDKTRKKNIYEV